MNLVPARRPAAEDLDTLWGSRPVSSPALWTLMRLLHRLPWPAGERILGAVFVVKAFVTPGDLLRALAWASASTGGIRRWRLALSLLASRGGIIARGALIGMRSVEDVRRRFTVRGQEHLDGVSGAVILLGFHVGPPYSYAALRDTGRSVTLVAARCLPEKWSRQAWGRSANGNEDLLFGGDHASRARVLRRAQQVLRQGGMVYITADTVAGLGGREAFRVSVHGTAVVVQKGWLALRRATGAAVLPVLAHLEGDIVVVSVHPPLPKLELDPAADADACRGVLERLLREYARRFPDQCWSLPFPPAARLFGP